MSRIRPYKFTFDETNTMIRALHRQAHAAEAQANKEMKKKRGNAAPYLMEKGDYVGLIKRIVDQREAWDNRPQMTLGDLYVGTGVPLPVLSIWGAHLYA